jgi:hypothetical protein
LQRGRDQSVLILGLADSARNDETYWEEQREILLLESCVNLHPINAALDNHIRVASFVKDAIYEGVLLIQT